MKPIKTLLVLFLATLIAMPCMGEECRYRGEASIFVPFSNAMTNANLDQSPEINVGFDGDNSYYPFIMDTGSCGIVASQDIFQPAAGAINLGPGSTEYTNGSFVKVYSGNYYTATQQLYDEYGNILATSDVPVLQVTQLNEGGTITTPTKFALMGIGFGRENPDVIPAKTPAYNVFLNLTSIFRKGTLRPLPKDWVNGYVISPRGAELGLTAKNTTDAGFIKLTLWPEYSTRDLPEWTPMSGTLCINGVCAEAQSVMDTGITGGILLPPSGVNLGTLIDCPGTTSPQCVPDGNVFDIYYPNETHPVAFYTFTTGQTGNPMQPASIAIQTRPTIYWNTSRHFLGGMNFVYDNKHGYAGFIWNHQTSSDYGYVIPSK